jgi:putative ABC transport system ATP-binding protein
LEIQFNQIKPGSFQVKKSDAPVWESDVFLNSGKTYQIIASSGSGKTTFISMLAGLRGDYEGNILINGKSLSAFKPSDWSEWRGNSASFVFQDLRLFPELSAKENIVLSNVLSTEKIGGLTDQIELMAEQLGVRHKLNTVVKFLSFGQMQRVAIIRALSRPYKWLFLDEPFSHLDHQNAINAWNIIVEDAKKKKAGIVITSLDPYPFIHPDQIFVL